MAGALLCVLRLRRLVFDGVKFHPGSFLLLFVWHELFLPNASPFTTAPMKKRQRTEEAYFDFEFRGGQGIDDAKLLALKRTARIENPRKFMIHEPYWSDALLQSFLEVFRHFSENNIQWESLELIPRDGFFCSTTHHYLRTLLLFANTMNLFQRYELSAPLVPVGDYSEGECILSGIALNTRLKALAIDCPFEILPSGDYLAILKLLKKSSSNLEELTLKGLCVSSNHHLSEALAANKTLKKLTLNVGGSDAVLANLVDALANHPNLKELTIHTYNQFGSLSSKALQRLLLSSIPLETLTIQDKKPYFGQEEDVLPKKLNARNILQGMEGNHTLRELSLKNVFFDEESLLLSRFFQVLQAKPQMERFDLLKVKITEEDLQRVVRMDRLQKPMRLQLDRCLLKDYTLCYLELLSAHPEIRRPWPQSITATTKYGIQLQHVWDLNFFGRHLMMAGQQECNKTVPLALWPLVLESAHSKPSVMYELLKGPAFAGKLNFI